MWGVAAGLRVSEVVALQVIGNAIGRFVQLLQTAWLRCRDNGSARARSSNAERL